MKKLKISIIFCLFGLPLTAFAASLVDSYLDGAKKVCKYDDGSVVYVSVTAQCPIMKI